MKRSGIRENTPVASPDSGLRAASGLRLPLGKCHWLLSPDFHPPVQPTRTLRLTRPRAAPVSKRWCPRFLRPAPRPHDDNRDRSARLPRAPTIPTRGKMGSGSPQVTRETHIRVPISAQPTKFGCRVFLQIKADGKQNASASSRPRGVFGGGTQIAYRGLLCLFTGDAPCALQDGFDSGFS